MQRAGRLKKELSQLQKEPVPGINVSVDDSTFANVKCEIIGKFNLVSTLSAGIFRRMFHVLKP